MTKIDRAVGKAKVAALAPDNTNRLITEAILRELLFDLWDSGALQIDEETYFNLRELADRPYKENECMVYDSGSGFNVYRAVADTNGIPFNSANWEQLTGVDTLQDLQSVMAEGGKYLNGSNDFVLETNTGQYSAKFSVKNDQSEIVASSSGPTGGYSFKVNSLEFSLFNGLQNNHSAKHRIGQVTYLGVSNNAGNTIGYNMGSGNGMYLGNSYTDIENEVATATFHVKGSVRFEDLETSTNLTQVLAVDSDGNIKKQTINTGAQSLQGVCTIGSTFDLRSNTFFQIGKLNPASTPNNTDGYVDIRSFEGSRGKLEVFSRTTDESAGSMNFNFFRINGAGSSSSEYYIVNSREVVGEKSRSTLRMDGSNGYSTWSQNSILVSEKDVGITIFKENENEFGFAFVSRSIGKYEQQCVREYEEILRVEGELYIANAKSFFGNDLARLRIETLDSDEDATKVLVYDEATGLVKKANKTGGSSGGSSSFTTSFFYPGNLPVNTTFNLGYGMGTVTQPIATYSQLMPAIVGGSSTLQFIGVLSGGNYIAQSDTDFTVTVKIYNISKSNPLTSAITSSANLPNNASWKTLLQTNLTFLVDPTIKFYRTDMVNLSGQSDVKSLDPNWTDSDRYICVCQISQTNTPFNSPVPDVYVELDWKG